MYMYFKIHFKKRYCVPSAFAFTYSLPSQKKGVFVYLLSSECLTPFTVGCRGNVGPICKQKVFVPWTVLQFYLHYYMRKKIIW